MAETEEQTEPTQVQDDGEAEMDATDVPETETDTTLNIPTDRPAKEFFQNIFVDHEITQLKSPAGRSIKKYVAICPVCHKTVSSTDSFYGFRAHYQTKHPELLDPPEHEENPVKRFRDPDDMPSTEPVPLIVPSYPDVSTLPWDASGKHFFQRLFINHLSARETRKADGRSGTRYTAECKLCSKTLGGLDGFFKFREHYRLKHMTMEKGENGEETERENSVVVKSSKKDPNERPAREYFDTFYIDQSAEKDATETGKRAAVRYAGECKLCAKRVTGIDSFYGFRAHIKHKHKDIQVQTYEDLKEFITMPSIAGMDFRVANTETVEEAPAISESIGEVTADQQPEIPHVSAKALYDEMFANPRTVMTQSTKPGQKERKKFVADCKACGKMISGNSSYYNFKAHLAICGKETGDLIVASMVEKQVSVRARFTNSTHVASSSKNDDRDQLKLNRNVALCAAEVLIPFSALSSPAFDRLVKDIDSHLAWPTAQALTTKHLPELKSYIRQEILTGLAGAPSVGLTVNVCQSMAFVCVMVHYVSNNGKIRNPVLSYKRIVPTSSANVLFNSVVAVLKEFSLINKVTYVDVVDNLGANGGTAPLEADDGEEDETSTPWKTTLNQVKELLVAHLKVSECRVQMRHVIRLLENLLETSVRESQTLFALMKKIGNTAAIIKKAASLLKGTSAWGALYQKVKMAADYMREPVRGKQGSKLSEDEHEMLLELLKVAEAFDELFIKLRQEDSPTVCDLIPFVYGIHKWLSEFKEETEILVDFTDSLVQELDGRFEGVDDEEQYIIAAFLDPKYKLLWCRGSSATDKEEQVRAIVLAKLEEEIVSREDMDKEPSTVKEPPTKRSALLSFLGDSPASKTPPSPKGKAHVELSPPEEIEAYLEDLRTDEDPLTYWRRNRDRLPRLAMLSRTVLFIPSGTAKMTLFRETLFADRPLNMFVNQLEMLLFCHLNPEFSSDFANSKRKLP